MLNRSRKSWLLAIPFLFFAAFVRAEESSPEPSPTDEHFLSLPAHDVDCSQGQVSVGEPIRCRIPTFSTENVTDPSPGFVIAEPNERDALEAGWKAVPAETEGTDPQVRAAGIEFSMIALKPGRLDIPSLAIKTTDGKAIARTHPFSVDARSALDAADPKGREPEEIRDPVGLALPLWTLIFAVTLGLGIFLWMAAWAWKKWSAARALRKRVQAPPKSEDEVALLGLNELEKQAFWKQDKFKNHYFGVSEILKKYFSARYGFDALECTTEEMLGAIGSRPDIQRALSMRIGSLFIEMLDPVKFADRIPMAGESEAALSEARKIVGETARPKPHLVTPGGVPTNVSR